jgi:hypothetical protein
VRRGLDWRMVGSFQFTIWRVKIRATTSAVRLSGPLLVVHVMCVVSCRVVSCRVVSLVVSWVVSWVVSG